MEPEKPATNDAVRDGADMHIEHSPGGFPRHHARESDLTEARTTEVQASMSRFPIYLKAYN